MAELGTKVGSAFVQVGAVITGFGESLAADVSNAFLAQTFVVGSALESFGQAVFKRFSVPLLIATTANIVQFQALDREIRTVLTLFGTADSLVQDTFGAMAEGIREVALEVGGLERDIADGLYGAISAGVPRGGVFDFLNVAQMAAIADKTADLTSAVDGLTTVTNAFGLEFEQAMEIADVMFATVALGKTTFGELAQDIGRVAPLAANAGVSFQELFAIIGALTLQGLKTSESISFLRAAITGLLRPTDELNKVFADAGFASAEAAVPVIGLQQAFALVVDAVGGSTSKLQELIGTSEGVSAILGVTGDNAGRFANVMDGVENSTGGLTRAFEIMDSSVGRTFGRLTEAFDRLGNTFGEMASMFAVPVFEVLTEIINTMVNVFAGFRPIVEGLAIAFGKFVGFIGQPVIREIAGIFVSIAVAIGGALGALGLFSLTLGKIIIAGTKIAFVAKAWKVLGTTVLATQASFKAAGTTLAATNVGLGATSVAAGTAGTAVRGFGNVLKALGTNPLLFTAGILAVVAAIGLLVAAFGSAIKKQKEYRESQDIFGKQTDQLLESLDLVNQALAIPGAEEGAANINHFQIENRTLLNILQQTREELGEIAAIDLAEAIVVRVVLAGNAPEDALELQSILRTFTSLDISLDLSDLEDSGNLVREFAEGVVVSSQILRNTFAGDENALRASAEATAKGIVDLFLVVQTAGELDVFESIFNDTVELNKGVIVSTALAKALENQFEETFSVDLKKGGIFGIEADDILIYDELLGILDRTDIKFQDLSASADAFSPEAFRFAPQAPITNPFADLDPGVLKAANAAAIEFGLTLDQVLNEIPEGGIEVYRNLLTDMDGLFQTARENVLGAMGAIRDTVLGQLPLLSIYQGAVEQTFAEWKDGQDKVQADLAAITILREKLIGKDIFEETLAAFDAAPITEQAWLAGLGEKELALAIEEIIQTATAGEEAAKERVAQSFEGILDAAIVELGDGYLELQAQADEQGTIVGDKFEGMFNTAASQWPIAGSTWMAALEAQISRPLAGPVIGAPTFGGGFVPGPIGGETNINVYNTTVVGPESHDLNADLASANLVNSTTQLVTQS